MRHRPYRRWRPDRKYYRRHRKQSGYKAIAETALQVVSVMGAVIIGLLFKRKP